MSFDRAEPINEAWLREIGFEWDGGEQCFCRWVKDDGNQTRKIEYWTDRHVVIGNGGFDVANIKTRRDLMNLLAALGVKSK